MQQGDFCSESAEKKEQLNKLYPSLSAMICHWTITDSLQLISIHSEIIHSYDGTE